MVAFGKVAEKKEYALLEQGEYVLTLLELEEIEGQYGDRIVWKWLVAPTTDYSAYYCRADGQEQTIWAFTDVDIVLGSIAHRFAEAITRKKFGKDDEPPSEDDLVGGRVLAYVTHETPTRGKNAGIAREAIVPGSIKPFSLPAPTAKSGASKAAPPADAPDEGDRDLIVAALKKRVARLKKLDTENGQKAQEALDASELDTAPLADLERLSDAIAESITAALDA